MIPFGAFVAVIQDPNSLDSDNQENKEQTGNFNQPVTVSGNSASSGPGGYKGSSGSSGSSSSTPNSPTNSGSFQNLQNYLNANQNYVNQGGLASQLSGDYSKKEQGLQNNIQTSGNDWYSANSSKDINPDQANQYVSNALTDPSKFVNDSGNVSQFQNYLNAGNNYTTPGQFDPTQQYQNQIQNYQSSTNNLGTQSGRQATLQQMYNNPYYSQGKSNLDNLILSQGINANGQNQLQNLQNNVNSYNQNLQNAYNNTNSGINNSIKQYGQDAQTVQSNTQGALGGAINNFGTYANNLATQANDTANKEFSTAQSMLSHGDITSELAKQLGLDPNTGLYNVNASNFLTQNTPNATNLNAISAADQSKISALGQLAGKYLTGDPTSVLSNFANNTQAGTYKDNPYSYNTAGLNQAVSKAQDDFQNAYKGQLLGNVNTGDTTGWLVPDAWGGLKSTGMIGNDLQALKNVIDKGNSGNQEDYNNSRIAQSMYNNLMTLAGQYNFNPNNGQSTKTFNTIAAPQVPTSDDGATPNFKPHFGGMLTPGQ